MDSFRKVSAKFHFSFLIIEEHKSTNNIIFIKAASFVLEIIIFCVLFFAQAFVHSKMPGRFKAAGLV